MENETYQVRDNLFLSFLTWNFPQWKTQVEGNSNLKSFIEITNHFFLWSFLCIGFLSCVDLLLLLMFRSLKIEDSNHLFPRFGFHTEFRPCKCDIQSHRTSTIAFHSHTGCSCWVSGFLVSFLPGFGDDSFLFSLGKNGWFFVPLPDPCFQAGWLYKNSAVLNFQEHYLPDIVAQLRTLKGAIRLAVLLGTLLSWQPP